MSGFAGIIASAGADCDRPLLEHWAAELKFRGPDGTSFYIEKGAGFCFTFLKTGPAPQSEKQPLSLDGRVWFLGEARLDGREELLRQLADAGDRDANSRTTDEELILKAWRAWGQAGVERLEGDLTYVLWDRQARRLLGLRDLIGARPFYYALHEDCFYFSNDLKRIREVPGISWELDPVFIGDFLLQEWCADAERTAYRDMRRLPPGHVLTYADERITVRPYTRLPIEEPLWLKRPEEYVERFRELFEQAVRDRLPHAPAAIFLSGGLDSTSVAAVAVECAKKDGRAPQFRAFTADGQPLFDDKEGKYASQAAEHLGVPLKIISLGYTRPYEEWDQPELQTPEPHADPFATHSLHVCQEAACHARVALLGYGGDDILTGQAWPYLVYLLRKRRFGTIMRSYGGYLLRHWRIPPLRAGFRTRIRHWLGIRNGLEKFPEWLAPEFVDRYHLRERWVALKRPPRYPHPIHPLGYGEPLSHFWSTVFDIEDASWTGVPLESRAPLLDLRLLRFFLRLPPVPWCIEKELLRRAMKGALPDSIRLRPKAPLSDDPMAIHLESGTWSAELSQNPSEIVRSFVDWERLRATLSGARGFFLEVATRGVCLERWLKMIEKVAVSSLESVTGHDH